MNNLSVILLILISITTSIFASEITTDEAIILLGFLIISFVIILILYINSQNEFIDILKIEDREARTSKFWTWSQLVPIWMIVAQIVTIMKLTKQYQAFIRENSIFYGEIEEYQPVFGWLYIGFALLGFMSKIFAILAIIFFIAYWSNILKTTKSIKRFLNMQENLELDKSRLIFSRA